jgi:hypothetical protein
MLNANTSGPTEYPWGHSDSRRADGRRESSLGSTSNPRGIGQAGHRGVGADCLTAPAATPSPPVTDLANVPSAAHARPICLLLSRVADPSLLGERRAHATPRASVRRRPRDRVPGSRRLAPPLRTTRSLTKRHHPRRVPVKRSRRAGERGHTGQPGAPIRSRSFRPPALETVAMSPGQRRSVVLAKDRASVVAHGAEKSPGDQRRAAGLSLGVMVTA